MSKSKDSDNDNEHDTSESDTSTLRDTGKLKRKEKVIEKNLKCVVGDNVETKYEPKGRSSKRHSSSSSQDDMPRKTGKYNAEKRSVKEKEKYAKYTDSEDEKHMSETKHRAKEKEPRYSERSENSDSNRRHRSRYDDRKKHEERSRDDKKVDVRGRYQFSNRYRSPKRNDSYDKRRETDEDDKSRHTDKNNRNSSSYSRDKREEYYRHTSKRRRSRSRSFDHKNAKWGKGDFPEHQQKKETEKQKPNFALSGKLTEETNTYKGVVIKYSEPPEARKPKRRWRLYPFKGEKAMQTLYIHRESAYLIGRDRKVVDLPVDHPSCSKQHAALQYRLVSFTREDGTTGKRVRPYLIDLDSANGTYINNKRIEPRKYVELLEKDVIKFGYSSREYVLLHENSKDEAQDDDVKQEEEVIEPKTETV